jgi:hypothetical protein
MPICLFSLRDISTLAHLRTHTRTHTHTHTHTHTRRKKMERLLYIYRCCCSCNIFLGNTESRFLVFKCFIIAKAAKPYSVRGCTPQYTSVKYWSCMWVKEPFHFILAEPLSYIHTHTHTHYLLPFSSYVEYFTANPLPYPSHHPTAITPRAHTPSNSLEFISPHQQPTIRFLNL